MKNKIFTLFFALVASIGTMFAGVVKIGDLYYNLNTSSQTAEVTSQPNGVTVADIPSYVTYNALEYGVTSIGNLAFHSCQSLTSVTIPNSVVNIGGSAFSGCSNLLSVNLPEYMTKISDGTFEYCAKLTYINIPEGIDTIGSGAFSQCKSLISISIPNNVTYIGHDAFGGCSSLTSVVIPNNVEGIENGTFAGCTNLASVMLPENLTWIGNFAFAECSNLTSITIPNKVEVIQYYAFENDSNLTSLTLGSGLMEIGGAFTGCYKLMHITCFAIAPPILGTNSFQGKIYGVFDDIVYSNALLYVPAVSIDTYKVADQWKDFYNIYTINAEEIRVMPDEQKENSRKFLHNGQIFFLRGDHTYTLTGQEVK